MAKPTPDEEKIILYNMKKIRRSKSFIHICLVVIGWLFLTGVAILAVLASGILFGLEFHKTRVMKRITAGNYLVCKAKVISREQIHYRRSIINGICDECDISPLQTF